MYADQGQAGPESHWWTELAEGRFLLQRSRSSGSHFFPPRVAEPCTGTDDLEWVEARGGGAVYSATVIRPRPPAQPYNVVLVDLDEGPRLMSRVEGVAPGEVRIGMRVAARIDRSGASPILLFVPA